MGRGRKNILPVCSGFTTNLRVLFLWLLFFDFVFCFLLTDMCRKTAALEGHANVLNRLSRKYGKRQHEENMKGGGEAAGGGG